MANNIFLSGEMGSGKTTIIKRVIKNLNLTAGGFMVGRKGAKMNWSYFYILPADVFLDNNKDKIKEIKYKGTFAWHNDKGEIEIDSSVFDDYGVNLLSDLQDKEIVIMDELGRFELEANKFQTGVIDVLKSDKIVLGVIKRENNIFLDKVRNILEEKPLLVKKDNREKIYKEVLNELKKLRRMKND